MEESGFIELTRSDWAGGKRIPGGPIFVRFADIAVMWRDGTDRFTLLEIRGTGDRLNVVETPDQIIDAPKIMRQPMVAVRG